jgi:hypothetical protein
VADTKRAEPSGMPEMPRVDWPGTTFVLTSAETVCE